MPAKPRVLITESHRFPARALDLLRDLAQLSAGDLDRPALLARVPAADVLWVRLRHQIDAEILAAASNLKVIVSATTGLNHIDLAETGRRGIQVLSLQGEKEFLREVRATAEHTVCLMLTLLRHLPAARQHVLEGGWNRDLFWGQELHRKTIGIVGYGRLGRLVAGYLLAFGVRVLVNDPVAASRHIPPEIRFAPLKELLGEADIVTLHVNFTPENAKFFGKEQFAQMKRGSWFINTARGELVDESTLLHSLETGHLAGAALDVLANERAAGMGTHPLVVYGRTHRNLLITPHIGGCTVESIEKTEVFMAEKLADLLHRSPVWNEPCAA